MKKKTQKIAEVEARSKEVGASRTLVFASFDRLPINELNQLRRALRAIGATLRVVKKRLLRLILAGRGITFEVPKEEGQTSVVFSPKDTLETAHIVYAFVKAHETFRIVGGAEVEEKKTISADDLIRLGQLPGREALLGQLCGVIAAPLRQFLFALNERATRSAGLS